MCVCTCAVKWSGTLLGTSCRGLVRLTWWERMSQAFLRGFPEVRHANFASVCVCNASCIACVGPTVV